MRKLNKITIIAAFIAAIIVLYSIVAAIWGFNPTGIEYFNLKLFGTAIFSLFVLRSITYVIENE